MEDTPAGDNPAMHPGFEDLQAFLKRSNAEDLAAKALNKTAEAAVKVDISSAVETFPQLLQPESSPEVDLGTTNWVGLLTEYRQKHPPVNTTICTENSVAGNPTRFTCSIQIAETTSVFGSDTLNFSVKKNAKRHACKCALEWLAENGYISSIHRIAFAQTPVMLDPTLSILGAPRNKSIRPPLSSSDSVELIASYSQQVDTLARKLGYNSLSYVIQQNQELGSMYSGWAHFGDDPRITGKVGEFFNVFGRKQAKEQCAEQVLPFLQAMESDHNVILGKRTKNDDNGETNASVH